MVSHQNKITPAGYPDAILKGDVLTTLFEAVQGRLKALLPAASFYHDVLPPHASRRVWDQLLQTGCVVAVGFAGWRANEKASRSYTGTVSFPIAIVVTHADPRQLYLGTGEIQGMGVTGVMAALAGGLHNWTVPSVGTCRVQDMTLPNTDDWFDERKALIAATVVFENVELSNIETLALLDDFITQTNLIDVRPNVKITEVNNG